MKFFCFTRHSGASRNPSRGFRPAMSTLMDSGLRRNDGILFVLFVLFVFISLMITTAAHADTNAQQHQLALGKYIASMCTTCHQPDKSFEGIPPILNLSAAKLSEMMQEYKDSTTQHEVMENIAKSLSEAEITALSLYIESQNSRGRSM